MEMEIGGGREVKEGGSIALSRDPSTCHLDR